MFTCFNYSMNGTCIQIEMLLRRKIFYDNAISWKCVYAHVVCYTCVYKLVVFHVFVTIFCCLFFYACYYIYIYQLTTLFLKDKLQLLTWLQLLEVHNSRLSGNM